MNKAITEGLVLMPPPFSAGLNLWSREDGLTGQGSYLAQSNAAFVPSDQDFGGCLELTKTLSTMKLRCFQSIPIEPGLYLRVTAKVKAVSGAMPSVRIAGWAGNCGTCGSCPSWSEYNGTFRGGGSRLCFIGGRVSWRRFFLCFIWLHNLSFESK